jgi:hypothetical protein
VVMILSTQLQARKLSRSVFLMEMICYYLSHVFSFFFPKWLDPAQMGAMWAAL